MIRIPTCAFVLLVTVPATVAPRAAEAAPVVELMRSLERELDAMDAALEGEVPHQELTNGVSQGAQPDEGWHFRNFWIRLRMSAGFEIPGLAKLTLIPEVELLWQRSFPKGWSSYRPPTFNHSRENASAVARSGY